MNSELLAPPLRRSIQIMFIRNNVQRIKNRKNVVLIIPNTYTYIYIQHDTKLFPCLCETS